MKYLQTRVAARKMAAHRGPLEDLRYSVSRALEAIFSSARMQGTLKRGLDIIGSVGLIICLAPLFIVIAAAVMLTSRGGVLFTQQRNGRGNVPFKIYKFRTMFVDAERNGFVQAQRGDPRITRIGSIMRRTSIDELPQLFNVLKGEMSLVGPRPHPAALDDEYRARIIGYDRRYHVRPGITGLAQISGSRGPTPDLESMRRRMLFDLVYVRKASLLLDIKILVATIAQVLIFNDAF